MDGGKSAAAKYRPAMETYGKRRRKLEVMVLHVPVNMNLRVSHGGNRYLLFGRRFQFGSMCFELCGTGKFVMRDDQFI